MLELVLAAVGIVKTLGDALTPVARKVREWRAGRRDLFGLDLILDGLEPLRGAA